MTTVKPNGRTGLAQTVIYEKAVDGKFYIIEAVPDTKAKTAFVVSAYMQKRAGTPLQTVDEQTSTNTAQPENAIEAPAPTPSVTQDSRIVNPSAAENSADTEIDRAGKPARTERKDEVTNGTGRTQSIADLQVRLTAVETAATQHGAAIETLQTEVGSIERALTDIYNRLNALDGGSTGN